MLFVILSVAKYLDFYAVIRFFTAFRMTSPRQKMQVNIYIIAINKQNI